ncbi:TetR/AcrR family transcriptional regulator [Dongia sp.]|uniref:TetR/AcrR family transcriptional regulator n=1 Tax=Dongia sp. TaxID=1977262 RepID=UPI0035B150E3
MTSQIATLAETDPAGSCFQHPRDPETGEELPQKAAQVMEAGSKLFTEHGFAAVSMDQVAKAAGVSKATVYAHFQSKEQLFIAIVRAACLSYAENVMPEVRDAPDMRAALTRIGYSIAGFLTAPRTLAVYRVIVAEGPRFPELARSYYDIGPRTFKRLLANYLLEAQQKGLLKIENARLASDQFCSMVRGPLYMPFLLGLGDDPETLRTDTVVEGAVEVFLRAYGPDVRPAA